MEFSSILNSEMFSLQPIDLSLVGLVKKIGLAALLGIFLSVVIRRFSPGLTDKRKNQLAATSMQHTHIMLCIGGAFIMIIIGNSLANAFGLTGALSMIRFRTNLINPREAAVIILVIAIGMACGLAQYLTALVMTALTVLILIGTWYQHKRMDSRFQHQEETYPNDL